MERGFCLRDVRRTCPPVAIHAAIATLVAAGVLVPLTASRRNQSWEAAGLLDLLASLETGEAPPADMEYRSTPNSPPESVGIPMPLG